jgi:hypothetical protein
MAKELPTPPANVTDGLFCMPLPDGRVTVIMVRKKKSIAEITVQPEALSGMLATLATTGTLIQNRSVAPLPAAPETVICEVSTIGLVDHPRPGYRSLLLSFGKARLAVGVPPHALQPIGQAMLASAPAPAATKAT